MSINIYILKLKGGKYYVGKSEDPMKRYQEHLDGNGSAWTKKYIPIKVEKMLSNKSPFMEDMITKEYMAKYGIDNVRGGSYVTMEFDDVTYQLLTREIRGATDACTRCGRKGHFVNSCYVYTSSLEESESENESESESESENESEEESYKKKGSCYRCGRTGHYSPDCYASRHVKGYSL